MYLPIEFLLDVETNKETSDCTVKWNKKGDFNNIFLY